MFVFRENHVLCKNRLGNNIVEYTLVERASLQKIKLRYEKNLLFRRCYFNRNEEKYTCIIYLDCIYRYRTYGFPPIRLYFYLIKLRTLNKKTYRGTRKTGKLRTYIYSYTYIYIQTICCRVNEILFQHNNIRNRVLFV